MTQLQQWSAGKKQVEKRTAAERAEYMRNYHASRKIENRGKYLRACPVVKTAQPSRSEIMRAWWVRNSYLKSVGGFYPERGHESWEQTVRRVQ